MKYKTVRGRIGKYCMRDIDTGELIYLKDDIKTNGEIYFVLIKPNYYYSYDVIRLVIDKTCDNIV